MERYPAQGYDERQEVYSAAEGIILSPLAAEDADRVVSLIQQDPEHFLRVGEDATVTNYPDAKAFLNRLEQPTSRVRYGIWADGELVGSINYEPHPDEPGVVTMGYWVGKEYAGHRYAARAARVLVPHIFAVERGCNEVQAWVRSDNVWSRRTLLRASFSYDRASDDYLIYKAFRGNYPRRDIY